jgi:hypothetical protein
MAADKKHIFGCKLEKLKEKQAKKNYVKLDRQLPVVVSSERGEFRPCPYVQY